ncbi:MAG: thiolase domain-containing protein [Candidatus Bathyarchaeia archaeon]
MRKTAIVGCGMTKFGRRTEGLIDLMTEACHQALRDSNTLHEDFQALFVGNMACNEFEGIQGPANALCSRLGLEPAFASRLENTTASGASAALAGWLAVASGTCNLALVAGGERMTTVPTQSATDIIARMLPPHEYTQGFTLPSMAGLLARRYMLTYNASREALAQVAVKNHHNASLNPDAHLQNLITVEDVLKSPSIADPLRLYDFCPISDGAAAIVLAPLEEAAKFTDAPVLISGIGAANDTHAVQERKDFLTLEAVRVASDAAYRMAGREPREIDVAETHDMATILEIVESEDLGFFEKGEGLNAEEAGTTALKGELPLNTSGGLKARGHPLGATGVAQIVEVVHQLQRRCGRRQVEADVGLACNMAGFGHSAIVSIMERAS